MRWFWFSFCLLGDSQLRTCTKCTLGKCTLWVRVRAKFLDLCTLRPKKHTFLFERTPSRIRKVCNIGIRTNETPTYLSVFRARQFLVLFLFRINKKNRWNNNNDVDNNGDKNHGESNNTNDRPYNNTTSPNKKRPATKSKTSKKWSRQLEPKCQWQQQNEGDDGMVIVKLKERITSK